MATVRCPSCGKPLKVREELVGKKLKCPGCRTNFLPDGADVPDSAQTPASGVATLEETNWLEYSKEQLNAFYRDFIQFKWTLGGLQLRSCTRCNGKQFSHVRACDNCNGVTVGLD